MERPLKPSAPPRTWRSGPTKSIRVPVALAEQVLALARELDRDYVLPAPAGPPLAERPHPTLASSPDPAPLEPPGWVRDAVFYQIFVDRFANGDRATDPPGAMRWGSTPRHFNHFGGDLAGVREKLPYLQDLGVNALYLNPIFKAPSNHKYDTADYMQVDPSFGTTAEFERLIAACHARGIRVMLDGVFNHTGDRHPFFRDCVRKGPASRYWGFYHFHGYPVVRSPRPNYEAWWGYAHLPKLRVAENLEVQAYLHAVTAHWTRMGIDGWRLDVPTDIASPSFWREWRERVRAINPQAYLVGEIWEAGLDWINGKPFDAVTNYLFRQAALDFLIYRNLSVDGFDARLAALRDAQGPLAAEASFNLLASHDVPRLLTEANGDLARVKAAVFLQMVWPGAPVIYYGEELGLTGGKDPGNRRCMPWSKVRNNELLAFYKQLVAVRQSHKALRGGTLRTLLRHNDFRLFGCLRESQGERAIVLLNNGGQARDLFFSVAGAFTDGTRLQDALTKAVFPVEYGRVRVQGLAAASGMVLTPARAIQDSPLVTSP